MQANHGLVKAAVQAVQDALWSTMGHTRRNLLDLDGGRHEELSKSWLRTLQAPRNQTFLSLILTDGVYTPLRAH